MTRCSCCSGSARELVQDFPTYGPPRWMCEGCAMAAAADRRAERNHAFKLRQMDEARAFRRNGP